MAGLSPLDAAPKLAIERLSKRFGRLDVLRDISVDVERGQFVAIVGPSGCGKTTFLRIVGGLERATNGGARLDGRVIDGPGSDRGFVFQQDNLLPWRNVTANANIGPEINGTLNTAWPGLTQRLLALVGVGGFERYFPRQLSGGMRQRVNLARALAVDPGLLLVFARRPGRISEIITIGLPRPRPLAIKRSPEFVAYVDRIWTLIEDDVRISVLEEHTG